MPEPSKPHVVLISYYFPPANAIGGVRPFRFYKYLKKLGYSCTVITASPEAEGTDADVLVIRDRNGEIWNGHATGPYVLHTYIEQVIRKFFMPGFLGLMWAREVAKRCRDILDSLRPDQRLIVLSSYPPLGVHLAGRRLAGSSPRLRWIADFRDPLRSDPFLKVEGYPKAARWNIGRIERDVFRRADAVIANVDAAASVFREQYPAAAAKLHVIYNGFDPEETLQARPRSSASGTQIVHAGSMYSGRNANAVIASLERLRRREHSAALETRVVLVGVIGVMAGIDEALYARAGAEGWLDFTPKHIAQDAARRLTEEADGLLLLQPQSAVQVPGKLFEYIRIGRPILALAPPNSAIDSILQRAGVPYVLIHPEDSNEAVDGKMLEYLSLPKTPVTPSQWFQDQFDARAQTAQLAAVIEQLSGSKA